MKIGIDVRYLSHGLMGGIHTYLKSLVPALVEQGREHAFVLYADDKNPFELQELQAAQNVTVRILPYRNALSSVQHDLFMRRKMADDGIDVAHFPANYGFGPRRAATVVTVHDALTLTPLSRMFNHKGSRRTVRSTVMMAYLHVASVRAVRSADLILTVSEHAREDIAAHSAMDPWRIMAAPHAPGSDMVRLADKECLAEVRRRLALPESFILADGLKNPAVLIRAWRRLPESVKRGRRIVFFSRVPDPLPIVFEAVAAGEAQLLVRPSRADVVALYNMAEVFVFPSWFEGFGIPVIEAMACGTPVIASDRYSIPEVAGGAALIIDAEDDKALAEHLVTVLKEPGEADRLRALGAVRARDFSWQHTAGIVLDAYARARQIHGGAA